MSKKKSFNFFKPSSLVVLILCLFAFVTVSGSPAQAANKIKLTFWHSMGTYQGRIVDQLIRDFNKASAPNVEVKGIFQGFYDDIMIKIIAAAASNDLPDISQISVERLDLFIKNGLVSPIDNLINEEDRKDILEPFWEVMTRKGKVWAMPFNQSVQVLFYNKDFFAGAGLDPDVPPVTWDDTVVMSQKLTEDSNNDGTPDKWGILIGIIELYALVPFIEQMGGRPFSQDMKKATFNDAGGIKALTFLQDLAYKYKVMPTRMTREEAFTSFLSGNIAMGPLTSAAIKFAEENMPWPLGVAALPRGVRASSALGGASLVVFKQGDPERGKAAWEFAKWMGNRKNTIKWHIGTGYLPIRKSALDSLEIKLFHKKNINYKVAVDQLDVAHYVPSTPNLGKLNKVIKDMMEAVVLGQADPKTELDKAVALADTILNEE